MIQLYGIPGTATTAPHMVLEEIGTMYEFVLVERTDGTPRELRILLNREPLKPAAPKQP